MMRHARTNTVLIVLLIFLWAPQHSTAAQAMPAARDHSLSASDLEAFFDGIMAAHFQSHHIPGAAVAVVKDGKLLFAKGYGYADLENGTPVEADKTLFRIGSISKLFTWTAVMQLVERGLLDLDQDINTYLAETDIRVPTNFPGPITMAHLMNHTAGFEDYNVGLFSRDPASVRPLSEVLARTLPTRVRPPGEATAYSNHGTALAAYVVEVISGMPWATYAEDSILKPLHMEHTTPRQPVSSALAGQLARGYKYEAASAQFRSQSFEYVPAAPAGALSATATDMAKFMIAHLQSGDSQILREETARTMHSTSFLQHPLLGGISHGFLEQPYGRLRTIGHGGDTFAFHAELRLVPSHNLGIFVAYNSAGGIIARDQLMKAFLDRYFGSYTHEASQGAGAGPGAISRLEQYAGVYRPTRRPRTTADRLIELMSAITVRVHRAAGDTGPSLLVTFSPGQEALRFRELEAGVFQEVGGSGRISFVTDERGRSQRLLMGSAWMAERVSWYQTPGVQIGIAVACLLLFLSVVIGWPVAAVRRWRGGPRFPADASTPAQGARVARWLAGVVSALFLVAVCGLLVTLGDPMELAFGVPQGWRLLLGMATLSAVLSPIVLLAAAVVWRRRYLSLAGRVHYSLVALASVAFALWLNHWNLLGFRF